MLPVTDVARARRFYEQQLGLHATRTLPNGDVLFQGESGEFELYPRETPPQSDHTAMSWEVPDVRAEMKELRARGVRFEEYPELRRRTVSSRRTARPVPGSRIRTATSSASITRRNDPRMERAALATAEHAR
jgi:catechol 2,3-dioxygenase-like lactoylglutathione lyase family enzyme